MTGKYAKLEGQAQPGWFSGEDMQVLDWQVKRLSPHDCYVEIGVHKGRSLSTVRLLRYDLDLYGVDVLEQPELTEYLALHPEIRFFHADSVFASMVWNYVTQKRKINLLFIDGDHSYEGCKRDIEAWTPLTADDGIILFHDYDPSSPGVIRAVDAFAKRLNLKIQTFGEKTSIAKIQL